MLFELATGNLAHRIEPTESKDEIEELNGVLNILGLTLQNTIKNSGYVIPYFNYQSVIQNTFLLSKDYSIKGFNPVALLSLGYTQETLSKMTFDEIIDAYSLEAWHQIKEDIISDEKYQNTIHLILRTATDKLIPFHFTVSRLHPSDDILMSSLSTVLQDTLGDTLGLTKLSPRRKDAVAIQNVYNYILNNLEDPLPSVKELAKKFGSNEFKLKDGFRHFFNTSIYQFYNEERLKKAHNFIQRTDFPLKEIAFMSGFNSYLNFYKAFKKKYKYAPSELSRLNNFE